MNKNMTKFLILAIILCITVGVASATEASSDDTTAQDAPTITKNTPTTEKIITKTENKKINKNNKTTNVKKDTGNLYVSPDVTEAKTGTNEDPTTIIDAVSKVTQNGNIILLPGTTGVYTPTELITISDETTQSGTNKFSITAQNKNIMIDASQVVTNKTQSGEETEENYTSCLFKINSGYDITLNNVSISNAQAHAINITNANLTLNGEATYENCYTLETTTARGGVITGSGNVNIIGSNTFKNNFGYAGGSVIALSNGNLTINGENLFIDNSVETDLDIYGGVINIDNVALIINGSNNFINNSFTGKNVRGGVIYSTNSKNCTIAGKNSFINNHIDGSGTTRQGAVICYISPSTESGMKIIGENIFEDNYSTYSGGVIYFVGQKNYYNDLIITERNVFKNNKVEISNSATGGAIYADNVNKLVLNGSNTFNNNQAKQHGGAIYATTVNNLIINGSNIFNNNQAGQYGGAIYITSNNYANLSITGDNTFENNSVTDDSKGRGAALYTSFKPGATFTSKGSTYINNHATVMGIITGIDTKNNNVNIILSENKFINNTSNQYGILTLSVSSTDENSEVTIQNNIFEGNTAEETIYIYKPCKTSVENNTYINTSIGIDKINLTSDMENQEIGVNTPITLNINTTLIRPEGYETNITEQFEYQIYINDENKYNTTGNTITITEETEGTLNIYAKYGEYTSNNITITIIKPLASTIYVSPDVIEAHEGTLENPTTIYDAISKVANEGNIILLPGTTGVYKPTELINISDETTQSGTNKFSITAQNKNIKIDASEVFVQEIEYDESGHTILKYVRSCLLKIDSGYDITLNNVSIINAQAHAINITNANLTLNGEATYENCITPILRRTGTEYLVNSELQPKGGVITGSGNVNIKGSNTFKNNQAAGGGAVLSLSYGTLTITGQNLFVDNNIEDRTSTPSAMSVPGLGYFGGLINTENVTIFINGSNKFTNNTYIGEKVFGGILYSKYGDCTIVGENEFINNHIEGTTTSMQGGVIYMQSGDRSSLNIIGSNKFEYNTGEISGGVISISGTKTSESILNIIGSNVFKNNEVRTNGQGTIAKGGVIYTNSIDKIVINGSNIFKNNEAWESGGVLYSIGMHENANITITGNNLFENNSVTGYTGKESASVFYIAINTGLTVTSTGSTYINNHVDGRGMIYAIDSKRSNVSLIFLDNKFINNTSNQYGILFLSVNGTDENNEITIKNNIFEGNTAEDTTYIFKPCKTSVENNTYINTYIAIDKINLTSDMENQEIGVNTPITLNINTTLIRPEGYETNITEQFEYQIYINDENKYNTTGNTITITEETEGTLNIYAKYGDYTSNNITITLISLKPGVNTTTENLTIGETTKLVATFFTDEGTPVTGGRAIFRVNGKTLRDEEGNVIYVDVINGKAETPNVMITKEWMKPDTNIQALYSGTDEFTQIITEKTFIEVTKPEANIELTIPEEATAGQTITLKAKVTYEDANVTTGRVVFKLNGKTLKDENGNALYVNVENGIATTTYTIPAKTKAKTYTLSAVFTDNNYLRSEKEENILVNK